ncbi:hypothetical protein [Streptomyces sp. NPDC093097]|uniref:hypothetical protein n=1 Tax=Streptomyces sp. NPDC093097 TaxID=3366027 RepID=UPI00380A1B1C
MAHRNADAARPAGRGPVWAYWIGHSTPTKAAVLQQDGTIIAVSPDSPSLAVLRNWLTIWEDAGRPAPKTYTSTFTHDEESGPTGWSLRLAS